MFRAGKRWSGWRRSRRTHVRSRGQAAWTKSRPRPRQRCGCRRSKRASLRRNRTQRAATLAECGACAARLVGGSTVGRQQQGWSASAGRRDSCGSKTEATASRTLVFHAPLKLPRAVLVTSELVICHVRFVSGFVCKRQCAQTLSRFHPVQFAVYQTVYVLRLCVSLSQASLMSQASLSQVSRFPRPSAKVLGAGVASVMFDFDSFHG